MLTRRALSTARVLRKESVISSLNVLAGAQSPQNNIDTVTADKIIFTNGVFVKDKVSLLLANQVLQFEPKFEIKNGFMVEFAKESLEFLKMVNPHPDLFVLGLGSKSRLLSDVNLKLFQELGVRVEVSDTKNAAKNFDLLATERPGQVGAILLSPGV